MNKEIAKQWCDALRSGKYKQCQWCLCRQRFFQKQYCCLGVLCELHSKATGQAKMESHKGKIVYDWHEHNLPKSVVDWAGMKSSLGDIPKTEGQYCPFSLADANDRHGYSFEKIAEIIEKNVDQL